MVDEIYDRMYQDGRADLHAGLDRAFARIGHSVGNAFKVLQRIEYSAPWNQTSKKVGRV